MKRFGTFGSVEHFLFRFKSIFKWVLHKLGIDINVTLDGNMTWVGGKMFSRDLFRIIQVKSNTSISPCICFEPSDAATEREKEKRDSDKSWGKETSCWLASFFSCLTFSIKPLLGGTKAAKKQTNDQRKVFTITQSLTPWKMSAGCLRNPKYVPYANSLKGRIKKEPEEHGNRKR